MGSPIIQLPPWVRILRGLQLFFAIIIFGMCCDGIYWVAFNSWIFALFTCLCTFIIVLYNILTYALPSCQPGYHYWAVLALEIYMVIFWLSSMAALAATRATFVYPTTIDDCTHYGVGETECDTSKLRRRGYVASDGYLAMMAAAAGLSAIELLLFIGTISIFGIHLKRYRSGARPSPLPHNKQEAYPLQNPVYYNEPVPPQPYSDGRNTQTPYAPAYGAPSYGAPPPDSIGYPQQTNQPQYQAPVTYQQYAPVATA